MMKAVTMPNMPLSDSAWVRMWQWNAHTPGFVACTSTEYRSPGRDEHRVGPVRRGERHAVLGDHELLDAVQVHRVHLQTLR